MINRPSSVLMATIFSILPVLASDEQKAEYQNPAPLTRDVRSLYVMQDATAQGRKEALVIQKELLSLIKTKNSERPREGPSASSDALAIVGYVLSGGDPGLADTASRVAELDHKTQYLLVGVAAFMRGNRDEAAKYLNSLEPLSFPAATAGRLALAKAIMASADHAESEQLLAIAIASMPGTLVEESALRRSTFTSAITGKTRTFWRRVERYMRRFSHSLYAAEFMTTMTTQIPVLMANEKSTDLRRYDEVLSKLETPQQRLLYLQLARQAAAQNLSELTQIAAGRLRQLSKPHSSEEALADLYASIFGVVESDPDAAIAALHAVAASDLPSAERDLLKAALAVAENIRRPPEHSTKTVTADIRTLVYSRRQSALVLRAEDALRLAGELTREYQQ